MPCVSSIAIHSNNRVGAGHCDWHSDRMSDYERVALIIKYLDEHHVEQPDLTFLAMQAGLSPFHFHRLFTKWAGVTPKDFLQCLTLAHAKTLLRRGESILQTSLKTGLSGPGRLHDLTVNIEAVSPGELKDRGAGLEIQYGFAETPFGEWLAAETQRGLCHVAFIELGQKTGAVAELKNEWPEARLERNDALAKRLSREVFSGHQNGSRDLTLRAYVRATPFQLRVWRALLKVPVGNLVSYGRLAGVIGSPNAARAVGSAVGQNPLACLIPCHRVIRETGVVGDYRWGRTRKRSLLAWESSRPT
jgi:AraC family transcriptional regulator, regulatory protein of adaptative response / methylated-DNA-[protein]-cysteine methyltransferase